MENVSKRLNEAMERAEISQSELVRRTGINKGALSCYLNGKYEPKQKAIFKLALALNVNEQWLMGYPDAKMERTSDKATPISIKFDDYFPLHYCTNLSCGSFDELLDSEPDSVVYVPIKYQHMKDRLYAFKVNGTSMNNVIEDESIVITESVGHLSSINPGTIVVALLNGEATVKRLFVNEKTITLMPDSSDKAFQPIMIDLESEKVEIVGRVIWHMNPDNISDRY